MNIYPNRRKFVAAILYLLNWITLGELFAQQPKSPGKKGNNAGSYVLPSALSSYDRLSIILGRVTDRSIVVSALSKDKAEIYLDYGYSSGKYTQKTKVYSLAAQEPLEFTLEELKPDTEYFFRVQLRKSGEKTYTPLDENRFHTQRVKGSTFTFAV